MNDLMNPLNSQEFDNFMKEIVDHETELRDVLNRNVVNLRDLNDAVQSLYLGLEKLKNAKGTIHRQLQPAIKDKPQHSVDRNTLLYRRSIVQEQLTSVKSVLKIGMTKFKMLRMQANTNRKFKRVRQLSKKDSYLKRNETNITNALERVLQRMDTGARNDLLQRIQNSNGNQFRVIDSFLYASDRLTYARCNGNPGYKSKFYEHFIQKLSTSFPSPNDVGQL